MRFRKRAPAVLIAAVAIVIAAITLGSNLLFGGMASSVERSQVELMRSIVAFNLEGTSSNALARAEMLASDPLVRQLLAAQDRPGLLTHVQAMVDEQREKYGVDQVQFHLPPATSFLRVHAPDQFGDDLSRFRPMVVAVNREHTARRGLAIARTGPAIFGVAPVRGPDGAHVGSVEFGMDIGAMLDRLKAAYGLELTLYLDEAQLRAFAVGMPPAALAEQNRVGANIRLHSTNAALMNQLVGAEDLRVHEEPVDYVRTADGIPYGVVLVPIRNAAGEMLGTIAVARNFEPTRGASGRSTVLQGLFAVLGFLVLAGLIIVVIRGFVLRPMSALTARFAMVGSGERAEEDEDDRFFCAEIAALAAEHERIADLVDGPAKPKPPKPPEPEKEEEKGA